MACIYPFLLYRNLANQDGATVALTNEDADFPEENGRDWFDYSLVAIADGAQTIDITLSAAADVDSAAVYFAAGAAGTVDIYLDTGGGFGASLATFTINDKPQLKRFASTALPIGGVIRFAINNTSGGVIYLRQFCAGEGLLAEQGQRGGLNPPVLNQGLVVTNNISVNGSMIGRDVRQLDRRSTIALEYLTEAWVRTYWEDFTTEAIRHAFFYAWDPDFHPDEVVMASAETINGPVNMDTPVNRMSVTMPIRSVCGGL